MIIKKTETNTSGKPGRSNRLISLRIILIPSLPTIVFSLLGIYIYRINKSHVAVLFFIVTSFLYLVTRKIEKEVNKTYENGAKGEEKVFKYLREILPQEYYILNDVKIPNMGKANIDHIVIGPNGIFVIETKNYGGKVTIEGKNIYVRGKLCQKNIVRQAWHQTLSLKAFLKKITGGLFLKVQPVIVFSKAYVTNPGKVSGVMVLPLSFLKKYILGKKSPVRFTDNLCKRLYQVLKEYVNQPLN